MAPLTGFRRWLPPATQMRANSWMLMTGSLGMVASTLPVQWLMPMTGWRGLFWLLAGLVLLSMVGLYLLVPHWRVDPLRAEATQTPAPGYAEIWRHPYFRQMLPIGLINYGGMVAVQTLWAGPWMVQVAGYTASQAALWAVCGQSVHAGELLALGAGQSAAGAPRHPRRAADRLGLAAELRGTCGDRVDGAGGGLAPVGGLLCEQHLCLAVAARGGAGAAGGRSGARAVCLQPGHFCRRVCRAVGDRGAYRRVFVAGLGHGGALSRCGRGVRTVRCVRLWTVSARASAPARRSRGNKLAP